MKYTEVIGEIYKHTREKKGCFKETVIKDLIGIKIINRFEDEEILPDFLMIKGCIKGLESHLIFLR